MSRQQGFRTLLRYARVHSRLHVAAFFVQLAAQLSSYAMPVINMALIDAVILGGRFQLLLPLSAVLFGSLAVRQGLEALGSTIIARTQNSATTALRRDLFEHAILLDFGVVSQYGVGHLTSRIYSDARQAVQLIGSSVHDLCLSFLGLLGAAIVMLVLDVRLGLVTLAVVPVFIMYTLISRQGLARLARQTQERNATVMQRLQTALSGIATIRAFGAERTETADFEQTQSALAQSQYAEAGASAVRHMATGSILALGQVVAFVLGAFFVIRGEMTVGKVVAFTGLLGYAYGPCQRLVSGYLGLQSAFVASQRVVELFQWPREAVCASPLHIRLQDSIELTDVTYRYSERAPLVLKDVSLTIPQGTIVAVVGPSGSGKSTLGHLLMGFAAPRSGSITVDGRELDDDLRRALRAITGYVSQEPYLFPGNVLDNLMLSQSSAETFPDSPGMKLLDGIPLDSTISETGTGLSVGQKQRVSIARALAKCPQVLILDEPTSAADRDVERRLTEILTSLKGRLTVILFSHRPSTVQVADTIYVISGGRVVARGEHEQLVRDNSFYRGQFLEQEDDNIADGV